jgi:hypothetical protein
VSDSTSHSQRAQTGSRAARKSINTSERLAFSPKEFASFYGRHPSWAYRLLYANKLKAVTELGRILIPASEMERLHNLAGPYNPDRKLKTQNKSGRAKSE